MLACATSGFGQGRPTDQDVQVRTKPTLGVVIDRFDITDAILRDGLSELSPKNVEGLHLGFEEIIRDRIQDAPGAQGPHFSLHLQRKTVRDVLDELCKSDGRYEWSEDGASVNVYPRATADGASYLLNLWIDKIGVSKIPDPDAGPGLGDNAYAEPWTAVFERLTVRQFIDRIAEHMGPRTSWVWQGGKNERMFTFVKGGFHTQICATAVAISVRRSTKRRKYFAC